LGDIPPAPRDAAAGATAGAGQDDDIKDGDFEAK